MQTCNETNDRFTQQQVLIDAMKIDLHEKDNAIRTLLSENRKLQNNIERLNTQLLSFQNLNQKADIEKAAGDSSLPRDEQLRELQRRLVKAESRASRREKEFGNMILKTNCLRCIEAETFAEESFNEVCRLRSLKIPNRHSTQTHKSKATKPPYRHKKLSLHATVTKPGRKAINLADKPKTKGARHQRVIIEAEFQKLQRLAQLEAECELEENSKIIARRLAEKEYYVNEISQNHNPTSCNDTNAFPEDEIDNSLRGTEDIGQVEAPHELKAQAATFEVQLDEHAVEDQPNRDCHKKEESMLSFPDSSPKVGMQQLTLDTPLLGLEKRFMNHLSARSSCGSDIKANPLLRRSGSDNNIVGRSKNTNQSETSTAPTKSEVALVDIDADRVYELGSSSDEEDVDEKPKETLAINS